MTEIVVFVVPKVLRSPSSAISQHRADALDDRNSISVRVNVLYLAPYRTTMGDPHLVSRVFGNRKMYDEFEDG